MGGKQQISRESVRKMLELWAGKAVVLMPLQLCSQSSGLYRSEL
jgi:hypothetical protein